MRHASLFSGIGGFDLAAQWMGWENVFQVEIDEFCQKVLAKNFPNTKRYGDIKQFNGTEWAGKIDVLTGGFPCQPFSVAGRRKGKEDDRFLWPQMLRIIGEIQPAVVVGENVYGIFNWSGGLVFEQMQTDLENLGYQVTPFVLPACGVNATHRRDRVWIIAHADDKGLPIKRQQSWIPKEKRETLSSTKRGNGVESKLRSTISRNAEPIVCGGDHGIPNRVDRIKSIGNAIVPQVAFEIFKAIEASTL